MDIDTVKEIIFNITVFLYMERKPKMKPIQISGENGN